MSLELRTAPPEPLAEILQALGGEPSGPASAPGSWNYVGKLDGSVAMFKGNISNSQFTGVAASVALGPDCTAIGASAFQDCVTLPSVALPGGLTSIGERAFQGCASLTEAVFPMGLEATGNYTFYLSGLTRVDLPDSLTTIGLASFVNCALTSLTLPGSVTSIGGYAFWGCYGLSTAIYAHGNAPTVGSLAFVGVTATVYWKPGTTGWTNPWNGLTTAEWTSYPNPMP